MDEHDRTTRTATTAQRRVARTRRATQTLKQQPINALAPVSVDAPSDPLWRSPRYSQSGVATAPLGDPKRYLARQAVGSEAVRLVGRLFWAAPDADGTAFRMLAEAPDGTGEGATLDGRAAGFPFGRREPLPLPDHAILIEGQLSWSADLDRRGPFTRLWLAADLIDSRRRPPLAATAAAQLRRRVEYLYAFHARDSRLLFRDYAYDEATGTLRLADWTAAGPGLAFVLARGLVEEPAVATLVLDFYDCPPPPPATPPAPRLRFHAKLDLNRLRGVHWAAAYPSTLRLLADEWEQPRGLGGQDFRGLGGV